MFQPWLLKIKTWLIEHGLSESLAEWTTEVGVTIIALLVAFIILRIMVSISARVMGRVADKTQNPLDNAFLEAGVLHRIVLLGLFLVLQLLSKMLFPFNPQVGSVLGSAMTVAIGFGVFAVLSAVITAMGTVARSRDLRNYQTVLQWSNYLRWSLFIGAVVVVIMNLTGSDMATLLTVIGGVSAVFLFLIRDVLLGFVGGVILSFTDMLRVDDLIEIDQYDARGRVLEITPTTIKVMNHDETITTVPAYQLISGSFKNFRDRKHQRVDRSIPIDVDTVSFLSAERAREIGTLTPALGQYVERRLNEIEGTSEVPAAPFEARNRISNLELFRIYVEAYLEAHPAIAKKEGLVRRAIEEEPTSTGVPVRVLAFTCDDDWENFNTVQANIFDHLLSSLGEFDLKMFQSASTASLRDLALAS